MKKQVITLVIGLFVTVTSSAFSQQALEAPIKADVNTPVLKLIQREDARAVVNKYMPKLVEALEESFEAQDFLGSSTLRELEIDDNHVIGFDEKMLESIKAELAALPEILEQ